MSRAILSNDVVKAISKNIRDGFEYKANTEALYDRLVELLVGGLENSDPAWNETKTLELNKFVKTQKRSSRRKRTGKKETGEADHASVAGSSLVAQPAKSTADTETAEVKGPETKVA